MAAFSIEIADSDVSRVIDAVCANYNRPDQVKNPDFIDEMEASEEIPKIIDNPETEFQFANRMVRKFLSDHVSAYEVRVAKEAAAATANTAVSITDPSV
tara:strand:+ start:837 stop:1133 length:297 start_codon:yes stop_codon:yes gene_type:complete